MDLQNNDHPSNVISTSDVAASSEEEEVKASSSRTHDPVDYMSTILPQFSREHLQEFLELAHGDVDWACSLLLESIPEGAVLATQPACGSTQTRTSSLDPSGVTTAPNLDALNEKKEIGCTDAAKNVPNSLLNNVATGGTALENHTAGICLSRSFIQAAHAKYASDLGLRNVPLRGFQFLQNRSISCICSG